MQSEDEGKGGVRKVRVKAGRGGIKEIHLRIQMKGESSGERQKIMRMEGSQPEEHKVIFKLK